MRLASFKVKGRSSYGAVTDDGIIDLARKLPKYPTLLDLFRGEAIGEARARPGTRRLPGARSERERENRRRLRVIQ